MKREARVFLFSVSLGIGGGFAGMGAGLAISGCDILKAEVPGDVNALEKVILADLGKPFDVILVDVAKTVAGDALQILADYVMALLDSKSITPAQRAQLEVLRGESHAKLAARR